MNIEVETVRWRIIYARHFFSRKRSEFQSTARFALSRIASGCLFLLYAVALAAFVICFFGVVPFYIVLYFEDVAAPWAARPIIHGFKLFLLLSTIAVIPMIVLANYARTKSTRRMMKDISSVYCGFTIPLTMLELINIYPAQWSAVDAMVMNQNAWTLYFSTQMLDGITLGHFTHFVTLPDFPTPESLYGKLLLFMMKIYFAAASTWYFYHKIRFRLTGALEITLSPQDLKSWLPRWASASSVDATKVRIKAIAVNTDIAKRSRAVSYEEMFGAKPVQSRMPLATDARRRGRDAIHGPMIHELPMFVTAAIMVGAALMVSLVSIPVLSQQWVDWGLAFLKYYAYLVASVLGALLTLIIASVLTKKWRSRRNSNAPRRDPPDSDMAA